VKHAAPVVWPVMKWNLTQHKSKGCQQSLLQFFQGSHSFTVHGDRGEVSRGLIPAKAPAQKSHKLPFDAVKYGALPLILRVRVCMRKATQHSIERKVALGGEHVRVENAQKRLRSSFPISGKYNGHMCMPDVIIRNCTRTEPQGP
jgi:hypothetical protein